MASKKQDRPSVVPFVTGDAKSLISVHFYNNDLHCYCKDVMVPSTYRGKPTDVGTITYNCPNSSNGLDSERQKKLDGLGQMASSADPTSIQQYQTSINRINAEYQKRVDANATKGCKFAVTIPGNRAILDVVPKMITGVPMLVAPLQFCADHGPMVRLSFFGGRWKCGDSEFTCGSETVNILVQQSYVAPDNVIAEFIKCSQPDTYIGLPSLTILKSMAAKVAETQSDDLSLLEFGIPASTRGKLAAESKIMAGWLDSSLKRVKSTGKVVKKTARKPDSARIPPPTEDDGVMILEDDEKVVKKASRKSEPGRVSTLPQEDDTIMVLERSKKVSSKKPKPPHVSESESESASDSD